VFVVKRGISVGIYVKRIISSGIIIRAYIGNQKLRMKFGI
jgi:hypothetical protein